MSDFDPELLQGPSSALVELVVTVDQRAIHLAQVGPNRMYFREPILLRPGPADLCVMVEGREHHTAITILPTTGPAKIIEYHRA